MNLKPTALLFSTVWPEPASSAAGVRQLQWVRIFKQSGYHVVVSSPSKPKEGSHYDFDCLPLPLNRSWIADELKRISPRVVMFDRFILEEQFGHFVYANCPDALVLLETEDLHFVRRARESVKREYLDLQSLPQNFYQTETALRETASIERVDYSYLISSFEEDLLFSEFSISVDKVQWVPLTYPVPILENSYAALFSNRKDFSWVGNFRHAPNIDGLRWFLKEIWPGVRAALPDANLNLFGAYPSAEVSAWTNKANGVFSHGPAKTLDEVFLNPRVNLAPLRFGAGVKGKILEGFRYGVPCVSTKVGVEGLLPRSGDYVFPGLEANDSETFIRACVELYQNELLWNEKRFEMVRLLDDVYADADLLPRISAQIEDLLARKAQGHLPTWNSKILRHELMNSHKYFSKWIEAKELARLP